MVFIKGEDNIAADALSRLPISENTDESIEVMLNHPPHYQYNPLYNRYPLNLHLIADEQNNDQEFHRFIQNNPQFTQQNIANRNIIIYQP